MTVYLAGYRSDKTTAVSTTGHDLVMGVQDDEDSEFFDLDHVTGGGEAGCALQSGKYLAVAFSRWAHTGTNGLREIAMQMVLNSVTLDEGASTGLIYGDGTNDYCAMLGAAIVDVATDGHELKVNVKRTDSSSASDPIPEDASTPWNGISLLKLDDSWDFAHYETSATQAAADVFALPKSIEWDTTVNEDSASFAKQGDTSLIRLVQTGHYLVCATVRITGTEASVPLIRATYNGSALQTFVGEYSPGNTDGCNDPIRTILLIIEADAANQDLEIEYADGGSDATPTWTPTSSCSLQIAKLPDTGVDYLRLRDAAGGDNAQAAGDLNFDTQDEYDTGSFTHSTANNYFDLDVDGHFLALAVIGVDRRDSNDTDNKSQEFNWYKNASVQLKRGNNRAVSRGRVGAAKYGWAGGPMCLLIASGTSSDYVGVYSFDYGGADAKWDYAANRLLQCVNLDQLLSGYDPFATHMQQAMALGCNF